MQLFHVDIVNRNVRFRRLMRGQPRSLPHNVAGGHNSYGAVHKVVGGDAAPCNKQIIDAFGRQYSVGNAVAFAFFVFVESVEIPAVFYRLHKLIALGGAECLSA